MGQSSWVYFVPYQSDIANALHELKQKTYLSGNYYSLKTKQKLLTWLDSEFSKPIEDQFGGRSKDGPQEYLINLYRPFYEKYRFRPEPPSIDEAINELLEVANLHGTGTHSILDIYGLGEGFGNVRAFDEEELMLLFGTTKPTHNQMDEDTFFMNPNIWFSWNGAYLIVYQDGEPYEICFLGMSGD